MFMGLRMPSCAPHTQAAGNHFSGYLDVNSAAGRLRVFSYYVRSPDPSAPLLVWMNGGPGASSLMGFFTELGPFLLNNRSRPTSKDPWHVFQNPYAWRYCTSLP